MGNSKSIENELVIKHGRNTFNYSIIDIEKKMNLQPGYVVQNQKFNFFDDEKLERLRRRQTIPDQKIIYLSPDISLNSTFIHAFNQGHRQFETVIGENKISFLFRTSEQELKTYNIPTRIYSVKAIDKAIEQKQIEIKENLSIKSNCKNEFMYEAEDEDVIMMYEANNPSMFYCYLIQELEFLFDKELNRTLDVIEKNNSYWYRLPAWYIYVEAKSLRNSLQGKTNTIKLIPIDENDKKYYKAEPAVREDIFPKSNLSSTTIQNISNLKNPAFFEDEKGNLYNTRKYYYVDPETNQPSDKLSEIKTMKTPFDDQKKSVLHSLNDNPALIQFYENGDIKCKQWFTDGILNRPDKTAYIFYYENGSKESQQWFKNGKLHRDNDLPAYVKYYQSFLGEIKIKVKLWFINGKVERKNKEEPTSIHYFENGNINMEEWQKSNKNGDDIHYRDDELPSSINYYNTEDKKIKREWYININPELGYEESIGYGLIVGYYPNQSIKYELWTYFNETTGDFAIHRDGELPAVIRYYENPEPYSKGKPQIMIWYKKGEILNPNGPDKIKFDQDGKMEKEYFPSEIFKDRTEGEIGFEIDGEGVEEGSKEELKEELKEEREDEDWGDYEIDNNDPDNRIIIRHEHKVRENKVQEEEDESEDDDLINIIINQIEHKVHENKVRENKVQEEDKSEDRNVNWDDYAINSDNESDNGIINEAEHKFQEDAEKNRDFIFNVLFPDRVRDPVNNDEVKVPLKPEIKAQLDADFENHVQNYERDEDQSEDNFDIIEDYENSLNYEMIDFDEDVMFR